MPSRDAGAQGCGDDGRRDNQFFPCHIRGLCFLPCKYIKLMSKKACLLTKKWFPRHIVAPVGLGWHGFRRCGWCRCLPSRHCVAQPRQRRGGGNKCLHAASRFGIRAVVHRQTGRIARPQGPFGTVKRAVLRCNAARFAKCWHSGYWADGPVLSFCFTQKRSRLRHPRRHACIALPACAHPPGPSAGRPGPRAAARHSGVGLGRVAGRRRGSRKKCAHLFCVSPNLPYLCIGYAAAAGAGLHRDI